MIKFPNTNTMQSLEEFKEPGEQWNGKVFFHIEKGEYEYFGKDGKYILLFCGPGEASCYFDQHCEEVANILEELLKEFDVEHEEAAEFFIRYDNKKRSREEIENIINERMIAAGAFPFNS